MESIGTSKTKFPSMPAVPPIRHGVYWQALVAELNEALRLIDADKEIGTFFTTESEMAFAGHPGGAGIKELKNRSCE